MRLARETGSTGGRNVPERAHGRRRVIAEAFRRTEGFGFSRLQGHGAAIAALTVVLLVAGQVSGCRAARPGAPAQPVRPAETAVPTSTAADGYLTTETGHMAVEDQRRAEEAYRLRRQTVPHRDYPIRPVLPP